MNPGQLGPGISRPGLIRPGELGPIRESIDVCPFVCPSKDRSSLTEVSKSLQLTFKRVYMRLVMKKGFSTR